MLFTTAQITAWIGEFLWPLMRVGMVLSVAPIFGGRLMSAKFRLILAILITLLLVPVIPAAPAIDPLSAAGVLISLQQLLIGLVLGFMLQMVMTAMVIGGHVIGLGMGLGFASMVDPQNGISVPVIGQYYVTIATLMFLVLNGHLVLLSLLSDSFHSLPIAVDGLTRQTFWDVVAWASRMFAGGLLVAMPAVTALLLTNVAFGVITRAAPQLNIFGVGFPLTLTLGFLIIMVTLPGLLPQFTDLLTEAFDVMKGFGPLPGTPHG